MKRALLNDGIDADVPAKLMTNAFQLQCEDAERDRQADPKVVSKWEETAKKIAAAMRNAKLKHSCQYKDLDWWSIHNFDHPLSEHAVAIGKTTSSVVTYEWAPPKEVTILGESAINLLSSSCFVVEMFVTLPDSLFGKRDYVNLTYPAKRAHYLCSTVVALRETFGDLDANVVPGFANDNVFPNVQLSDKTCSGKVLIHFGASENTLAKNSRFSPSSSNLRASTIYPNVTDKDEEPTPYFNQRVLRTILESGLIRRVSVELRHKETLTAALALINRWFACRGLKQFDSVFLACFMVKLLEDNVVVKQQDLLTVLKNFFTSVVNWDTSSVMGFHPDDIEDGTISAHLATFPVVFLDHSGYWNVASEISNDSLLLAKADIGRSLLVLGDFLAFDTLFLERHHFFSSFDHYFRLDISPENLKSLSKLPDLFVDTVDENDRLSRFMANFMDHVHKCMEERFDNVCVERLEKEKDITSYLIGFRSKRDWSNPITMGPVATDPASKAFRALWKEKTQLRKFADARICECMVWADSPSPAVPHSILQFILVNHFDLPAGCVSWRSVFPEAFSSKKDVNAKITSAFANLSGILRTAKGLPLMITNIHGMSPYLRDTEPCASEVLCRTEQGAVENEHRLLAARAVPPYTGCITVHIKLEYSGKWGDTIAGVRQLSAAFYIEIGKYLKEKHGLIAVPTVDQLFVVKDGVVFKLVLVLDKVLKILEQRLAEVKASGATKIEMSAEGQRLAAWKKQYVHEALLQASLQSFATKHPTFGETVQIMKKWLAIHLLSDAIPDLALEMIVAAAFEHVVLPPPRTAMAAFRRVLQLIVRHNWTARPLFVDFDNAWNEDEIASLESNFVKMRPILPPMVIITNEDTVGSKWTRDGPTPLMLKRIIALANAMLKVLDLNYENLKRVDVEAALSAVDLSVYDAVAEIFPKVVVRNSNSSEAKVPEKIEALPVVNFDPVEELVFALNSHFQHVALFFWNKYGGDRIGIKWKPHELEVPAKISRCCTHYAKNAEASTLTLNKEEVLEGIRILGRGIVKTIQCRD